MIPNAFMMYRCTAAGSAGCSPSAARSSPSAVGSSRIVFPSSRTDAVTCSVRGLDVSALRSSMPMFRAFARAAEPSDRSRPSRRGWRRAVARGGQVSDDALVDDSASRIVKRYARQVGLEVAAYSGHSLRRGFLTSVA